MSVHYESVLNDLLNGQVDPHDPPYGPLVVVNPANAHPTGYGSPNLQQFQTGATQNVKTEGSREQGMGVGPERKWPHYPHAVNPNPYRNKNALQRAGMDAYHADVYRPAVVAYWAHALEQEQAAGNTRQRTRSGVVVNQAPSQSFTAATPPQDAFPMSPGGY